MTTGDTGFLFQRTNGSTQELNVTLVFNLGKNEQIQPRHHCRAEIRNRSQEVAIDADRDNLPGSGKSPIRWLKALPSKFSLTRVGTVLQVKNHSIRLLRCSTRD